MAGPDRDAVHGQRAELGHDPGGVVVAARARSRHDDQQVTAGHGGADRGGDAVRVVGLDRQAARLAAGLPRLRGQHERVGVEYLAGAGPRADRPHLVPGGQDGDDRPAPDQQLGGPRGRGRGEVGGPQPVPLGQQQLGGADVLADRADVLVGGHGGAQLGGGAAGVVDVLPHDHGVPPVGHRVAGVHHVVAVRGQVDGGCLAGTEGVGGAHGDPVHARRVEGRRRPGGPHGLGGDPARGFRQAGLDGGEPGRAARRLAGVAPGFQGAARGHVADERAVGHDRR